MYLCETLCFRVKRLEKIPPMARRKIKARLRALALLIRQKRKAAGFTQESFAEHLDLSVETIKIVEGSRNKRQTVGIELLMYICDELKIPVQFG
jgi:DNA-binding XRE family transcriptional regulator